MLRASRGRLQCSSAIGHKPDCNMDGELEFDVRTHSNAARREGTSTVAGGDVEFALIAVHHQQHHTRMRQAQLKVSRHRLDQESRERGQGAAVRVSASAVSVGVPAYCGEAVGRFDQVPTRPDCRPAED
jgi:hypothetical protein